MMQQLEGRIRAACERYEMIEDGDKIAVGLSGGKDSVSLLYCLADMRKYYPKKYDVIAVTSDMRVDSLDTDYSLLQKLCDSLNVEYIIKRTDISRIVFEERKEKNPCSLCAKMRRGVIHKIAKESGCNKVALGHHLDDAAETFIMNLFDGGRIDCFQPKTYLSDRDIYVIRPMIFASESLIAGQCRKAGLPVVKNKCPMDKTSNRQRTKDLLKKLNKEYPGIREKIVGALQRGEIDGW